MSEFDPYYTWLGIPAKDQPPTHYRLLAIEKFESNPDVIANAADRLMVYLRTFQTGQRSDHSQRLLNEVAKAKTVLLDGSRKAEYDQQLQAPRQQAPVARPATPREETSLGESPPATEGRGFGDYVLLDELSSSRTGSIYKASHQPSRQIVALKFLSPEAQASFEIFSRFRRKAKILSKLRHPNLVASYDPGEQDGQFYLVMEFVDGRPLSDWVGQVGPLPLQHAINYVQQAAAGLGYLHENGVIHRNVKPGNLLVHNQTGAVKVVGMGLARLGGAAAAADEFHTEAGRRGMGTIDYMAPEQIMDATQVDARTDIYALGCSLHVLLTGRVPYPGKKMMEKAMAHQQAPIPSLSAARSEAPPQLDMLFQRMLAKRPEDRFQSMDEVGRALGGI